jgi:hypothetical protein
MDNAGPPSLDVDECMWMAITGSIAKVNGIYSILKSGRWRR